ncbi:MAG: DNA gyrase subunit A [Deltaproteobacteria bacterium]|nr:MAG: DNA gyrase subunit A [Deltaproteobacteria bacterium]
MSDEQTGSGISIEKEMQQSYLDYAMSVIIGRALPDVRDGLKPVHRRILYGMYEQRNEWNKPYKKSARIVGDVIGKFHPHGDTAVYDAIVRMAQNFAMRYPLVDGQGNFGSIDGDSPAAMRYTEVRMQKIAHQILADLEKETVDFIPNYDESIEEPVVMPSRIPALLVNGSAGIAVGMATNIPPHNLSEVCNALIATIDNPEITIDELMEIIPGPDFPTSGIIYGINGIREAYHTGRGVIKIRSEIFEEEDSKGSVLVANEIPYQVNKARLIEKIAELARDKVIEGIRYVRDESDKDGIRVAVGLKRDAMAEVVKNQLYKHTQFETSFGINFLAVVDRKPEQMNLSEILAHFIRHRREVVIRRTKFDLKKAQARAHILEGLKIALDNIDEVVALIRASKSPEEAKTGLMEKFSLSQIQAQAILDMRLQRLTALERDKIEEEYNALLKDIAWYKRILSEESLVYKIIKDEINKIKEEFGDERKTRIVTSTKDINIEDLIAKEEMVVTITRTGYIKRTPLSTYQSQKRGGKGKLAMSVRDEDFISHLFVASTHDMFLFFTNFGKVYWSKVYELPEASRSGKGKALVNFLELQEKEELATILNVSSFKEDHYLIMATKKGFVKKTDIMAYSRPRNGGIIAIDLSEDDELIAVRITNGKKDVFLGSASGKVIRFSENDVRATGRVSKGVIGIRMAKSDSIVGAGVSERKDGTLFAATEFGYGKKTLFEAYPLRKRGGKGVINIKTSARNGSVVDMLLLDENDDIMLISDKGKLIRMESSSISVVGRNTLGVRLITLSEGEKLISAARIIEQGNKETEDSENSNEQIKDEE